MPAKRARVDEGAWGCDEGAGGCDEGAGGCDEGAGGFDDGKEEYLYVLATQRFPRDSRARLLCACQLRRTPGPEEGGGPLRTVQVKPYRL